MAIQLIDHFTFGIDIAEIFLQYLQIVVTLPACAFLRHGLSPSQAQTFKQRWKLILFGTPFFDNPHYSENLFIDPSEFY